MASGHPRIEAVALRHRDKKVIFELLHRLCGQEPGIPAAIAKVFAELNRDGDALDEFLNQQNYRLAYGSTADQELGYRRFFDINSLIGLRVERAHVFSATHCRIVEWLRSGVLDGVRVDHPDGLRDPQQYFERLREGAPGALEQGRINSLAQTLIRLTAPGVPDTYQGSELWDLRLVDPDNRGPVDYEARRAMLAEAARGLDAAEAMRRMGDGMPKLWIAFKALHLRREHPEWFGAEAAYTPHYAEGAKKDHVIAYLRGERVAAIVPRWNVKLGAGARGFPAGTTLYLPPGRWRNRLKGDAVDGGCIRVRTLLERFPVALLVRETE